MRKCTICEHPKVSEINRHLIEHIVTYRHIADKYNVSYAALRRHRDQHLTEKAVAAREKNDNERDVAQGDTVLESLLMLKEKALGILKRAEEDEKPGIQLSSIREARACIQVFGDMTLKLKEIEQHDVTKNPEFIRFTRALAVVWKKYPEAEKHFKEILRES